LCPCCGARERGTRRATSAPSLSSLGSAMPLPVRALARARRLLVRALSMSARALCLCVLAVLVLFPYSWLRCPVAEGSLNEKLFQGSACTLTVTPGNVASNGGVILWVSSDRPWSSSDNTSKAIASTHNGICLHTKRHLPPHQWAFANSIKGICPCTPMHVLENLLV